MYWSKRNLHDFHGLVQDCSISSTLAMEILQSGTKLSLCKSQILGSYLIQMILYIIIHVKPYCRKYSIWSAFDFYTSWRCESRYWQLRARLWYLQCISNGDTTVLHDIMDMWNYGMGRSTRAGLAVLPSREHKHASPFQGLHAKLWYLQWVSNGDTTILHRPLDL